MTQRIREFFVASILIHYGILCNPAKGIEEFENLSETRGEENQKEEVEEVGEKESPEIAIKNHLSDLEKKKDSTQGITPDEQEWKKTLAWGLRFDGAYSVGNPTQFGFSLPSFRMSGFGSTPLLDYRMSVGQTREWASAMIPQLTPIEAYLQFHGEKLTEKEEFPFDFVIGMLSPSLHPWWTKDLAEIPIPEYSLVHRAIFVGRDLGMELRFFFNERNTEIAVGAWNGTGILSNNASSSQVYNGRIQTVFSLPYQGKATLGSAGFLHTVSSLGSINYKFSWTATVFAIVEIADFVLEGDAVFGKHTDAFKTLEPYGGTASAIIPLINRVKFFSRFGILNASPSLGDGIRQFEIGPFFEVGPGRFPIFLLYQSTRFNIDTPSEDSLLFRVRFIL